MHLLKIHKLRTLILFTITIAGCQNKNTEKEIVSEFNIGNFENVIDLCTENLNSEDSKFAFSYRGRAYLKNENYNNAYNDFLSLTLMGDTSTNTLEYLAKSAACNGLFETGIKTYQKLIIRHPYTSIYYFYVAIAYRDLKNNDSALKFMLKAIENDPTNGPYLSQITLILYELGQFKEGIDYCTMQLNANNIGLADTAYFNRSIGYFELENYDSCLIDITKAININPDNVEYYFARAQLYKHLNKRYDCCSDVKKGESLGFELSKDSPLKIYCLE